MSFVAENRFRPFYFDILMREIVVSHATHSARENRAMFYKQVRSVNPATCNSISCVLTSFCRTHLQKKEGILALVPEVILKQNGCPIWIEHLEDGMQSTSDTCFVTATSWVFLLGNPPYTRVNFCQIIFWLLFQSSALL